MIIKKKKYHLQDMTWVEVQKYLETRNTAVIPLGAIEQHGPACPVGIDAMAASAMAGEAARLTGSLVIPCLSIGVSLAPYMAFPGTLSLWPETFARVVEDTVRSLHMHGFRRFAFVSGHGENFGGVVGAMQKLSVELEGFVWKQESWWEMDAVTELCRNKTGCEFIGHGGAEETSLMLFMNKDSVRMDLAEAELDVPFYGASLDLTKNIITKNGILIGDQRKATAEYGKWIFETASAEYAKMIKELEGADIG